MHTRLCRSDMICSSSPKVGLAFSAMIFLEFFGVGSSLDLAETLDDHGHALSTPHAHGFEAEGLVGSLESIE